LKYIVGATAFQVRDRVGEQRRRRLALVDVERAAVAQHHVEVVVAPEGVVPGQPVDDHRRLVVEEGPDLRDHLLVRTQHRLRVEHALRQIRRTGGEEDLRDGVGADLALSPRDRIRRRCGTKIRKGRHGAVGRRCAGDEFRSLEVDRLQGRGVARRIVEEDELRLDEFDDETQLAEILAQPRIGRRDRRHGNADLHRGQHQHRVVDAVLGQHQDRAFRREVAVEKRLRRALHAPPGFAVGDPLPILAGRRAGALGEKDVIGRALRPGFEVHAEAAGRLVQGKRRAQDHAARRQVLDLDPGRRKSPPWRRASGGRL
jgi:hypothetical protein